ncbi:MAG: hypothetical protein ACLFPF_07825 [Halanaerobiales bacterium]
MRLKKGLLFVLLYGLLIFVLTGCSGGGGSDSSVVFQDGSAEHPYLIAGAGDLRNIGIGSFELNKHYKLTGDIVIAEEWDPIGTEENPFSGVFDGNGYIIRGDINRSNSDTPYVGLFDYIGPEGEVKNIKWGAQIYAGDSDYVGAIAGYNEGLIEKVTFNGNVESTGDYVGSIAGYNTGEIIDVANQGQVYGGDFVGGLVGVNEGLISIGFHIGEVGRNPEVEIQSNIVGGIAAVNSGTIEKVSAINGTVYGKYSLDSNVDGGVGGIVGFNDGGTISECVSSITVNGKDNVGGMAGYSKGGTIINSYCVNSNISKAHNGDMEFAEYKNIGFFIGMAEDVLIENTYNQHRSNLEDVENFGYYIGNLDEDSSISYSYLLYFEEDSEAVLVGNLDNSSVTGISIIISQEDAENQESYSRFVFDTDSDDESEIEPLWTMEDNQGDWQTWWAYPKLISQEEKWLTHSDWRGSWEDNIQ